jgi:serine/threonine protein kinase
MVISSLNHPHICTLYDVGTQDGVDYLVMEYIDGETLEKRLTRGPLPLPRALEYSVQIADALDRAHRRGVVHRDLKPANV